MSHRDWLQQPMLWQRLHVAAALSTPGRVGHVKPRSLYNKKLFSILSEASAPFDSTYSLLVSLVTLDAVYTPGSPFYRSETLSPSQDPKLL